MYKNLIVSVFSIFALSYAQYDYTLEDINMSSDNYGNSVGTSYYADQVTLHYFGHYS